MSRGLGSRRAGDYRGKRALDLIVSIPLLVATAPIQAVTAIAVRLEFGTPVLFRQVRPGRWGEPFEMVKFRSMLHPDTVTGRVDDASRLTRLGSWLRATSLDELPALCHVISGRMSLVGPRPLLMDYLSLYSTEQARRHEARPGLTGLAQVSGRNELPWETRLALDVQYIDAACLRLDLSILVRTLARVWKRDGVNAVGHATVTRFSGTPNPEVT